MFSTRILSAINKGFQSAKCQIHQLKNSKVQAVTVTNNLNHERREPNPEYHHAPRTYVQNYQNFRKQSQDDEKSLKYLNARYRWADFRRRMVYGTYDI